MGIFSNFIRMLKWYEIACVKIIRSEWEIKYKNNNKAERKFKNKKLQM